MSETTRPAAVDPAVTTPAWSLASPRWSLQGERRERGPANLAAFVRLDPQLQVADRVALDGPLFLLQRRPRRAEVVLLAHDLLIGPPSVTRDREGHLLRATYVRLLDHENDLADCLWRIKRQD